jgi:lambda repressor-like predicted transcriptional regulator
MILDRLVIERARRRHSLTIKAMAEKAGISYDSARKAVHTGRGGKKVARGIAKALDLPMDILVSPFSESKRA